MAPSFVVNSSSAQLEHSVIPGSGAAEPMPQREHSEDPIEFEAVPFKQELQVVIPESSAYFPTSHASHSLDFVLRVNRPDGHRLHWGNFDPRFLM